MLLQELRRFRRTNGGNIPLDVLSDLHLPMPDDVFEQFVADHGTNEEFQHQYGHLDLHAIRWELAELPASEILACSIYEEFAVPTSLNACNRQRISSLNINLVNKPHHRFNGQTVWPAEYAH